MYDNERIAIIIEDINHYFITLENMDIKSSDDLGDVKYLASSMAIFSIINRTIDIAGEINRGRGMGSPLEYKDLFEALMSAKIISKDRKEKLSDLVRLRNKFAHRYEFLNGKAILDGIKRLEEVRGFIEDIKEEIIKK